MSKIDEQRNQTNQILSVLPKFTPINHDYFIYCINQGTLPVHLHDLISLAKQTLRFTIDTERDYYTRESALIQIEFINYNRSVVALLEVCHLPDPTSPLFSLIHTLMELILQPTNTLYGWGDMKFELAKYFRFHLFSSYTLSQINFINVQYHFKQWYNQTFLHQCGLPLNFNDHELCTCLYRPLKNKDYVWALQKAIAFIFNEFIDKTLTHSRWTIPFALSRTIERYIHLKNRTTKNFTEKRILYAVDDCFAVTKLWMVLEMNWTQEELQQYRLTHKR